MCRGPANPPCPIPIDVQIFLDEAKPQPSPKHKKSAWLARNLGHRTVSTVQAKTEAFWSQSQFLQDSLAREDILALHREDLELGSRLGQGAFSEVYQVDTIHGQVPASPLVVKHLRKDLLQNQRKFHQGGADLVNEGEFLARLDHPNICNIRGWASRGVSSFDDGEHNGYFLLLDRLDGTLSDQLKIWEKENEPNPKQKFATKLQYAIEIARAIEYLHDRDILYRDIKPDNIGLKDGAIQLFDLGLCRQLPESDGDCDQVFEMSGVGTRRYMSPEVALGQAYNLRADVFSVSMVLWELFAEDKPFEVYNRSMHSLLVCHEGHRPALDKAWPQGLKSLLQASWAADPSARPTMKSVRQQLEALQQKVVQPDASARKPRGLLRSLRLRFRRKNSHKTTTKKVPPKVLTSVMTSSTTSSQSPISQTRKTCLAC